MGIFREIRTVGIRDWCWWVFRLGRNEFHPSLNTYRYDGKKGHEDILARRQRAHRIDLALAKQGRKITYGAYLAWVGLAQAKGWQTPGDYTAFLPSTWVKYWEQCYAYELDPHASVRPVAPPHSEAGL